MEESSNGNGKVNKAARSSQTGRGMGGGRTGLCIVTKLFILLFLFHFTQEPCEGTCFSEQEVVNITNNIKELRI